MSDLATQTPANTYKGLLQVNDYTNGVDATAKYVQDGEGTNSALAISSTKVGIGTDSPSANAQLEVQTSSLGQEAIIIRNSLGNITSELGGHLGDGSGFLTVKDKDGNDQCVLRNNGDSFLNALGGKVGIGTDSPTRHLSVDSGTVDTVAEFKCSGDSNAYIVVKDISSSGGAVFGAIGTDTIIGTNGSTERVRIKSDGKVGMGTNTPSTSLDINKGLTESEPIITLSRGGTPKGRFAIAKGTDSILDSSSAGDLCIRSENHNILFGTAEATRTDMTIDSNGNVGINTVTPTAPLEVASTTGGVIMPRMNTTQMNAISSPTDGEMIYNTTANKFYGRANNAWVALH